MFINQSDIINKAYSIFEIEKNNNPWSGTSFEKYYSINARQKGCLGEYIVSELVKQMYNLSVENPKNCGHDRIINNFKTEIKFSCATKRNEDYQFTFNHIGIVKDWERIIFCGVNGDLNIKMVWFNKEDIEKLIEDGILKHQQGGAAAELDDWFSMGKNSTLLINHELAKSLDEF